MTNYYCGGKASIFSYTNVNLWSKLYYDNIVDFTGAVLILILFDKQKLFGCFFCKNISFLFIFSIWRIVSISANVAYVVRDLGINLSLEMKARGVSCPHARGFGLL